MLNELNNTGPAEPIDPMALLRRETGALDTPPEVEHALMAAFARQHPPRRWYHRLWPAGLAAAGGGQVLARGAGVAALALVAAVAVVQLQPGGSPPPHLAAAPGANGARVIDGAFVALEPLERIAQEAAPHMVEADVPRIALAALGVPVTPHNADQTVRAEMLVAADGQPLALRLMALN